MCPGAFPSRLRRGTAQGAQQPGRTVGEQVDDGRGASVGGADGDAEAGRDLREGGVPAQLDRGDQGTMVRWEVTAAVTSPGDDEHGAPLHERMRQVECGRTDDQRGPRAAWLRRQTPRSTARGPRSLRFVGRHLIGGQLEEPQ